MCMAVKKKIVTSKKKKSMTKTANASCKKSTNKFPSVASRVDKSITKARKTKPPIKSVRENDEIQVSNEI